MTRVLVTGSNGFIGARLVQRLGDLAVAAGRREPGPRLREWRGDWVRLDPSDRAAVVRALRRTQVDAVVHTAVARDPLGQARRETEVVMAEVMCSAAREAGLEHLVMLGSGAEYGRAPVPHREDGVVVPSTPHGVAKAAGARVALQWAGDPDGATITVLRPFHVIGVGEPMRKLVPRALAAARGGPPLPLVPGDPVRDVVSVDDVVEGIVTALASPPDDGLAVNLCSGSATSVRQLVEAVERALGAPVPVDGEHGRTPYDDGRRIGDPARAWKLWGWRARPLEETISNAVAAWPWSAG